MEVLKLKAGVAVSGNYTGIIEYEIGTKIWYKEGKLHREDGPAIEVWDGTKEWWADGKCHRIDGPAIERTNGTKEWWVEDIRCFDLIDFDFYTKYAAYMGLEKGKYGIEWVKFLTEEGIEEFPIVLGMKDYEEIKRLISLL